jgi:hypothetical protein
MNILVFVTIRMKEYFYFLEEGTVMKWQLCFLNSETDVVYYLCVVMYLGPLIFSSLPLVSALKECVKFTII